MKDIVAELKWRGLIYQTTADEELAGWLSERMRTVYIGFDPTADSLHIGSLLQLMLLRRFQKAGHRPIALIGGATGMIGDPSGKSKERNLLSEEALLANVKGIEKQMRQLLDFDCGENSAILVNNFDWMKTFSYIDFLRDIGKNFPVNVMVAKDSVKNRLDSPAGLSYTEFSYMLLQAYDFVHLNRQFSCELQVGGQDQWGNVTAGIDLGRRTDGSRLFGITSPLLTKSDGSKMGKTEAGTVWLSAAKTSPYNFYQYWVGGIDDDDIGTCFRFLTDYSQEEIENFETGDPREAKKILADAMTKLVHGSDGLEKASAATAILHGKTVSENDHAALASIVGDIPNAEIERSVLQEGGLNVIDAFVATPIAKSKSEVRRTLEQGGINVNNQKVTDVGHQIDMSDLIGGSMVLLRSGKKKYAVLKVVD
ncbi:MAG: tyrosine--tRNA ligase [Planctomycetota bacterium]|nr:tyrosine--tRNA ligase [Planctomycetota bacterium]